MSDWIRIWRNPKDVPPLDLDPRVTIAICTHGLQGQPLKIDADYLQGLKSKGWQGIEQIPDECIVESPS